MRRRGWGRDEEQLSRIRQVEMLVFGLDAGWLTEIHLDTLSHDCFAIEDLTDPDGGILVEEGDYDAPEGFERRPRMNRRRGVDEVFDGLEVVCTEYFGILEIGDKEGI
jgi:hypothetical protein